MKRIHLILINTIALTAASLIIKTISMAFQVYLANKMGAEGTGLFHIILNVYVLAKTIAVSGSRFTATRLGAEELARGNNIRYPVTLCITYGVFFGVAAAFLLFFGSDTISRVWLCDTRCTLALKILAIILPFVSVSAVMDGYFTAARRAPFSAAVQIAESLTEISVIMFLFSRTQVYDIKYACAIVCFGFLLGEAVSAILFSVLFHFHIRKHKKRKRGNNILFRMLKIALPVAFSAYLSSGMRTAQNLMIPFLLKTGGASDAAALSDYGIIMGMTMPLIMFPSVFLGIIADIIVPELSESSALGKRKRENYIVSRVFSVGMTVSICIMCILLFFAEEISLALYKRGDVAFFVKILSPLIPILYMDFIVDSALKGIGEQTSTLWYNIFESALSIILLVILIPRFGIYGYIITFYTARIINFILSTNRLAKKTSLSLCVYKILYSLSAMAVSVFVISLVPSYIPLYLRIMASVILYTVFLYMLGLITREDILWFKSIIMPTIKA